jgi:hypothetical protein
MDVAGHAGHTVLFGLGLWLACAALGTGIGAAVAAAQIFPGRWHPAWAANLFYWFSCPFFAGLASGVILALTSVPPLAGGRAFWLLLCLIIGSFTAVVAAGAVAYLSRNYDPNAAGKSKRISERSRTGKPRRAGDWEDRLRKLFRPGPTAESEQNPAKGAKAANGGMSSVAGQKAEIPPARFPSDSPLSKKPPHYAGHPRRVRVGQSKLEQPSKHQ